ncbi:MAG: HAD-IA family hydrolase [Pseudomonadota bacterium]
MRSVIFDLDGTLADTSGDLIAAANACFAQLEHPRLLDPQADAATALRGGRAMLRLGLERLGRADEAVVDRFYPILLDAYAEAIDTHTTLYPGAMEAVHVLKTRGFAVGICTNKPEGLARILLEKMGVLATFDALIGADTLPVRKPDPAPFHAAVERAGGTAGRGLLVGDTVTDRDTARAAGAPIVLVTFGPGNTMGQPGVADLAPDAFLSDYAALPALAERLLS